MRIYTNSGWSPMSNLRDDRVHVPRLNALKFLQWGCKNGGRGRRGRARRWAAQREALGALLRCKISDWESEKESPRWVPWLPLYRVWGQSVYKQEGSPDWRVVSLREVLANLACKLRRLVEHVWESLIVGPGAPSFLIRASHGPIDRER